MSLERRFIGFFPALPLAKNLEFDEWAVGTPQVETPWAPGRFRELSESLIRSFEKRGFAGGAWLWHRERGFDGSKPSDEDIGAIRAAVTFAVLDANDRLPEEDDGNKGLYLATTENADPFIQAIDETSGRIAHERGGLLKRTLVLGHKIGGEAPPLADAVQPIREAVPASRKLARAVFEAVRSGSGKGSAIASAAEWHRAALVNPTAVTMEYRLIALETGFEALVGGEDGAERAELLRKLFEDETVKYRNLLPWAGLLWSPRERTDLQRTYENRRGTTKADPKPRSELEHWFLALVDARNKVIHRSKLPTWTYPPPEERPMSRYAGSLFWKGERILREAIKAALGADVLLCGPIADRVVQDAAIEESRQLEASVLAHAGTSVASSAPELERVPRSLVLLC